MMTWVLAGREPESERSTGNAAHQGDTAILYPKRNVKNAKKTRNTALMRMTGFSLGIGRLYSSKCKRRAKYCATVAGACMVSSFTGSFFTSSLLSRFGTAC